MRNFVWLLLACLFTAKLIQADEIYKRGSGSGSGSGTLHTFVEAAAPVNGTDACDTGDIWFNSVTGRAYFCDDGATEHWTEVTAA